MKKIIILIFTVFTFTLCGSLNKTPDWYGLGEDGTMVMTINKDMNHQQLDSLCVADTIPNEISKWKKWIFLNENDGETICEYVYSKRDKTVYRLREINDSTLNVRKRTIK